eukprot:322299_1
MLGLNFKMHSVPSQYPADCTAHYPPTLLVKRGYYKWAVAHQIIINGYTQEHVRMSSVESKCGHIYYQDEREFCDKLKSALFNNWKRPGKDQYILRDLFNKCTEGICRQCALILCPILHTFISFMTGKQKELGISVIDNDLTIALSMFVSYVLQYPNLSMFYFKETKFLNEIINLHQYEFSSMLLKTTTSNTNSPFYSIIDERISHSYRNLFIYGNQLSRNLILFKYHQTEPPKVFAAGMDCFTSLILQEFDILLNESIIREFSIQTMSNMLTIYILLIHSGYRMKSNVEFINNVKKWETAFLEIKKRLNSVDIAKWDLKILLRELASFFVESLNKTNTHYRIRQIYGQSVWKHKWSTMQCQYYKCDKRRKDCKLYRCQCPARYCSKSHQKKDWKFQNHKTICELYTNIQNSH